MGKFDDGPRIVTTRLLSPAEIVEMRASFLRLMTGPVIGRVEVLSEGVSVQPVEELGQCRGADERDLLSLPAADELRGDPEPMIALDVAQRPAVSDGTLDDHRPLERRFEGFLVRHSPSAL